MVGYLPPLFHPKLREYTQTHDLSESAALVRIDSPAIFNAFRSILGLIRIPSVIELLG